MAKPVGTFAFGDSFSATTRRPRISGTFATVYIVAFDLDDRSQVVQAFAPRVTADVDTAIEEARDLGERHAGVIVWKRAGNPVFGEEGEPEIIFSVGRVGDYN